MPVPKYQHMMDRADSNCGWHVQSDGQTIMYCPQQMGRHGLEHTFVPAKNAYAPPPQMFVPPDKPPSVMKISKMFPNWFEKEAQAPESLNQFSPSLQDWIKQNKLKITPTKTGLSAEKLPNADPNAHPLHGKIFPKYNAAEDAVKNLGATQGKIIDEKNGNPPRVIFNHPQHGRFVISGWGDQAPKGQSKDFSIQHVPPKQKPAVAPRASIASVDREARKEPPAPGDPPRQVSKPSLREKLGQQNLGPAAAQNVETKPAQQAVIPPVASEETAQVNEEQQVEAPAAAPRKRRSKAEAVQQQPQSPPPWYQVPKETRHTQTGPTAPPPWYRVPPKPVETPSYEWKPPVQPGERPFRDGVTERTYEGGVKTYHSPFAEPRFHQMSADFHRTERDRLMSYKPQGVDEQIRHINMINGHLKAAQDHDLEAKVKTNKQKKPGFLDRVADSLQSGSRRNFRRVRGFNRGRFGKADFSKAEYAMPEGFTPSDPRMSVKDHQQLANYHQSMLDKAKEWQHGGLIMAHGAAVRHHMEQAKTKSTKTGGAVM